MLKAIKRKKPIIDLNFSIPTIYQPLFHFEIVLDVT